MTEIGWYIGQVAAAEMVRREALIRAGCETCGEPADEMLIIQHFGAPDEVHVRCAKHAGTA